MNIKSIIISFALMAMPVMAMAQSDKSNEQLSVEYKHKINILTKEIKTLKAKIKAEPGNADYVTEVATKKAELADAKSKKKVIDAAIKTKKANEKAIDKAEKAKAKAEKAAKAANELRKNL